MDMLVSSGSSDADGVWGEIHDALGLIKIVDSIYQQQHVDNQSSIINQYQINYQDHCHHERARERERVVCVGSSIMVRGRQYHMIVLYLVPYPRAPTELL